MAAIGRMARSSQAPAVIPAQAGIQYTQAFQ